MLFQYHGKFLSEIHPAFYFIRVWQKRLFRVLQWHFGAQKYSVRTLPGKLPYRYIKHSSKLIRDYDDPQLRQWQINKTVNLKLAIPRINCILIRPGETFSFCKRVGRPTRRKGFIEAMEISRGKARAGVGGGLCQLSNLLNWMAWHTPLQITERSHHSFDPFPDKGRVLPFGSGAAIFWNYVDLQILNPTENETFQLIVWMDDEHLRGEIRSDKNPRHNYHVFEKNHSFLQQQEMWFRSNEIWRTLARKGVGGKNPEPAAEEMLVRNFVRVQYEPNISRHEIHPMP